MTQIDPEQYREQLASLARNKKCRDYGWPRHWSPGSVPSPTSGLPFTESGAWSFIADLLESGHPIETVELKKPKGVTGFVMKVDIGEKLPKLYIKIHLGGSGKILAKSFHLSTPEE